MNGICPTTGKRQYASKKEALKGLERFRERTPDYEGEPYYRRDGNEPTPAMENMMAMLSFQSPDNVWVKKYFGTPPLSTAEQTARIGP